MDIKIATKLGVKPGLRSIVLNAPDGVRHGLTSQTNGPFDLALVFVCDAAAVTAAAAEIADLYQIGARLWFAYPKKSGAIRTDIDRDTGWTPVTDLGFLPVALVSMDETWSALRFRQRDEIKKLTRKM